MARRGQRPLPASLTANDTQRSRARAYNQRRANEGAGASAPASSLAAKPVIARARSCQGDVEYRSRAAARICRESPLTEWSATLAREGNGRPFPSATRRVRGLARRGQRPLPAIGFWGCRPAALFFQKGRRGLGNRCRHRSGQRPGQGGSRPDAQHALACGVPSAGAHVFTK